MGMVLGGSGEPVSAVYAEEPKNKTGNNFKCPSGSQSGTIWLYREHLAKSRDVSGCHNWDMLLAPSRQRPGMLLTILHEVYWLFLPQVPCDTLGLMRYLFSYLKEKKKGREDGREGRKSSRTRREGRSKDPRRLRNGLLLYLKEGHLGSIKTSLNLESR